MSDPAARPPEDVIRDLLWRMPRAQDALDALVAERDEAKRELLAMIDTERETASDLVDAWAERDEALRAVAGLRAAIVRYGKHVQTCAWHTYKPCDCGLSAALSSE